MADNVVTNPGSGGATFATDDVGGAHYQRIKPSFGADGAATDVQPGSLFPVGYVPKSPQLALATSLAVVAGAGVDLDSNQVGAGLTGKLAAVLLTATVPVKGELKTVLNGAGTLRTVFFVPRFNDRWWIVPSVDFYQQAQDAGAGFDGFRVTATNLDINQAADLYCTFAWDEV